MKAKRDPVGGDRYNDTPADNVSVQLLCGKASILVNLSEHPTLRSSVTYPWLRKSFDLGVT